MRCPFATWAPIVGAPGGLYVVGTPRWRTVLHTFEVKGDYRYNPTKYGSGATPPHFTVSVTPGLIHQHVDTDRSAYALRNLQNVPGETNRTWAVQIELMWQAADAPNMPRSLLDNLDRLLDWIYDVHAHDVTVAEFHSYPPENGVRLDGREPWRMTSAQWLAFSGLCGHQHVPENLHGDPGLIDLSWFRKTEPKQEDTDMARVQLHPRWAAVTGGASPYYEIVCESNQLVCANGITLPGMQPFVDAGQVNVAAVGNITVYDYTALLSGLRTTGGFLSHDGAFAVVTTDGARTFEFATGQVDPGAPDTAAVVDAVRADLVARLS